MKGFNMATDYDFASIDEDDDEVWTAYFRSADDPTAVKLITDLPFTERRAVWLLSCILLGAEQELRDAYPPKNGDYEPNEFYEQMSSDDEYTSLEGVRLYGDYILEKIAKVDSPKLQAAGNLYYDTLYTLHALRFINRDDIPTAMRFFFLGWQTGIVAYLRETGLPAHELGGQAKQAVSPMRKATDAFRNEKIGWRGGIDELRRMIEKRFDLKPGAIKKQDQRDRKRDADSRPQ
jgi:hypothetical protein